ncbi:uncharacterized protein LOC108622829 [Ceratina calcarata]|uniref:Uncharacterized protein LOC108622829 n=1 Tax=Ceratina calcarata TaxID=156304 RepID=A0AAJ7RXH7_9HYME|nr:uncharacterized protein LOC108622829 [Ceratina calcarata]
MGFLKSVGTGIIYIGVFLAVITFLPGLPPVAQFSEYSVKLPTDVKSQYDLKNRLQGAEILFAEEVKGPEAFASYDGKLYTGIRGGYVVQIEEDRLIPIVKFGQKCDGLWQEEKCGRPLGLRFNDRGDLFVADSYYGIFKVNVNTKQYVNIVNSSEPIDGKVPKICNSLDIAKNGDIYWSYSSAEFPLHDGTYSFLANPSGGLVRYNAATKKNEILLNNLGFANGVALSNDESFVIVLECQTSRIIKYHLRGPRAGQHEYFAEGLPGLPDNVQPDGQGGFLVSLVLYVDAEHPALHQSLMPHPYLRKMLTRLLYLIEAPFKLLQDVYPNYCSEKVTHAVGSFEVSQIFDVKKTSVILRFDKTGKVLDAIYSDDGQVHNICDAHIHNGYVWLGSPWNEYIMRVPLKQAFPDLVIANKKPASTKKQEQGEPLITVSGTPNVKIETKPAAAKPVVKPVVKQESTTKPPPKPTAKAQTTQKLETTTAKPTTTAKSTTSQPTTTTTSSTTTTTTTYLFQYELYLGICLSVKLPTDVKSQYDLKNRLQGAEILFAEEVKGPEAFASYDGKLYTGIRGGYVVQIEEDRLIPIVKFGQKCDGLWQEEKCGRPLGLRFNDRGDLFVADSYYGIFKVNVNTKQYVNIVNSSEPIDGKVPKICNSLDIAKNGDIYWSYSSAEFPLHDGTYSFLANPSGGLVRYNAATKKNEILLNNLGFANGVALSNDESFVIVLECQTSRIIKYHLRGPRAGQHEYFAEGLPGLPDNVQPDGQGGFLVSLVLYVDAEHPALHQSLMPHPYLRKMLTRLLYLIEAPFKLLQDVYPNYCSEKVTHAVGSFEVSQIFDVKKTSVILRFDKTGKVLDAIYSDDGQVHNICDAHIHNGYVWLGSPWNEYIMRVPLKQAFPDLVIANKKPASTKKQEQGEPLITVSGTPNVKIETKPAAAKPVVKPVVKQESTTKPPPKPTAKAQTTQKLETTTAKPTTTAKSTTSQPTTTTTSSTTTTTTTTTPPPKPPVAKKDVKRDIPKDVKKDIPKEVKKDTINTQEKVPKKDSKATVKQESKPVKADTRETASDKPKTARKENESTKN